MRGELFRIMLACRYYFLKGQIQICRVIIHNIATGLANFNQLFPIICVTPRNKWNVRAFSIIIPLVLVSYEKNEKSCSSTALDNFWISRRFFRLGRIKNFHQNCRVGKKVKLYRKCWFINSQNVRIRFDDKSNRWTFFETFGGGERG